MISLSVTEMIIPPDSRSILRAKFPPGGAGLEMAWAIVTGRLTLEYLSFPWLKALARGEQPLAWTPTNTGRSAVMCSCFKSIKALSKPIR